MPAQDPDWPSVAYALAEAASRMQERWDARANRTGDGKRATAHADLIRRVSVDLEVLAALLADPAFAVSEDPADRSLAEVLAPTLEALGADLGEAAAPSVPREPPAED